MKSIQEIEAMMLEYVTVGNPEAKWKTETIEFLPGLSIKFDNERDPDYPFAFHVCLTFAGASANTVYHLGVGSSLLEELHYLSICLCEEIEKRGKKYVRDEIKQILHI